MLLAATFAYTVFVYYGVGPLPRDVPPEWWHASASILKHELSANWRSAPAIGVASLTAPAALLALGVFLTSRSACARALAMAATTNVALLAFYGLLGRQVWGFFSWRGTAVLVAIAALIGFALTAPLLARSWMRQRGALKVALYVPILIGVVALMRHATGTNPAMAYNVSPWPAISVMGLDVAVYVIGGLQLALAVGLIALAVVREQRVLALLLGLCVPVIPAIWLLLRHPSPGVGGLVVLAVIALGGLALCATGRRLGPQRFQRRAFYIALGASLALLPTIAGQSMAAGDFAVSRFVRAQQLIDQLGAYFDKQGEFPDEVAQLVEEHYLDEIPRPRVGFDLVYQLGWLKPIEFGYQNLGSSYILEFESTEWVQCAYNPPWTDDEELEEGEELLEIEEVWSCPDSRPELW
jgi:hypothetical protein